MKRFLKVAGILAGLVILMIIVHIVLTPWMDRWGATDEEIAATFPGDELVPEPASLVNRAIGEHPRQQLADESIGGPG